MTKYLLVCQPIANHKDCFYAMFKILILTLHKSNLYGLQSVDIQVNILSHNQSLTFSIIFMRFEFTLTSTRWKRRKLQVANDDCHQLLNARKLTSLLLIQYTKKTAANDISYSFSPCVCNLCNSFIHNYS